MGDACEGQGFCPPQACLQRKLGTLSPSFPREGPREPEGGLTIKMLEALGQEGWKATLGGHSGFAAL